MYLKKKYDSEGVRCILSLLLSTLVCTFTWMHYGVQFSGMDDYALMAFLSGDYTGQVESFLYIPNIVFTLLVGLLYRITANVAWFTIIFMVGIFLSVFVLAKSILKQFDDVLGLCLGTVLFGVLFVGLYMYPASLLQFTSVSCVCGAGSVVLTLVASSYDSLFERVLDVVLYCVLTVLGLTIRKDTGYIIIAVVVATFIYRLIAKDVESKKVIIVCSVTVAFFAIACICHVAYWKNTDWSEYERYNKARANVLDYPSIIYENDPEFFDSIGWDEELVNLAEGNWYSMDDTIEVEDLEAIRIRSDEYFKDIEPSLFLKIKKVTDIGFTYRYLGFWGVALFVCVLCAFLSGKKDYDVLGAIAFYLGAVALIVFMGVVGRMTFALMNGIFLLAMPASILLMVRCISQIKIAPRIVVLIFVMLLGYKMLLTGRGLCQRINHHEEEIANKAFVDEYIQAHDNNLYIYDTNMPMMGTPFDVPSKRGKYNLLFWGGTFYNSPAYHRQLARCGYDKITSEYWFNDDVYYMTQDEPNSDFVEYMSKHYPGCEIKLVDEQDVFNVYKCLR